MENKVTEIDTVFANQQLAKALGWSPMQSAAPLTMGKHIGFIDSDENVHLNKDLGFDTDFHKLMEIVCLIETKNFGFKICRKVVEIYDDTTKEILIREKKTSKFDSLYTAIFEFSKVVNNFNDCELLHNTFECQNCKETLPICKCIRNRCIDCQGPVGNITFTLCDECWDKNKSSADHIFDKASEIDSEICEHDFHGAMRDGDETLCKKCKKWISDDELTKETCSRSTD